MTHNITVALLAACALTACKSTINMPLDHAKLADGYINSATLDFGHVLVWDTKSNRVESIYRITPQMVPTSSVDSGPSFQSKDTSVSRDTKIELSAAPTVTDAAKVEATAQFINSTDVTLTNYNPREYKDARYTLNSPELRQWRQSLSEEYTGPEYRFVFISRVTDGDEIHIGRKSAGNFGADANIVQAGQYKFKVTYDNELSKTIKAKQAPLTVQPSVFSFRIRGDSYRFDRDLKTPFQFQSVNRG
jgi:hypothetical protein